VSPTPGSDWLTDLAIVAGRRRYPDRHLLYQGVVHHGTVQLTGKVADSTLQQLQVEHYAGGELVRIQVVPLRRGKFSCPVDLHRGHNDLVLGTFDASGRAQARHVVFRTHFREWVEIFLVALSMALVLKALVAQAFVIPSESMRPTLEKGDRILVDKFFYHLEEPRRGDLVVFDSVEEPGTFFVKRVIGLPGERVTVAGTEVFLDDRPLSEPYREMARSLDAEPEVTPQSHLVEPEHLYMLGDDRLNSRDSRVWGTLPRTRVVGRALLRYWPPQRLGILR
jgi:signal peptidase I